MAFAVILLFLCGAAPLISLQGLKWLPKIWAKNMANYTITKRQKGGSHVYSARVREKEQGVVIFSRSKTFHTKSAAVAWGKNLVNKIEHSLDETDPDLVDCTFNELIDRYIDLKEASNKQLGRTAYFGMIRPAISA